MSSPQARLEEIFAALKVRTPTAIVQAEKLYNAKRIWEEAHPASKQGGDRKSKKYRDKNQNENFSFCSVAAKEIDCTERNVQLAVRLAEDLGEALIDELRDSGIADNAAALRLLAELEERDRKKLVAALRKSSFREALIATGIRRDLDIQEALFQRFIMIWKSASPRTKRRITDHIGHA
jgi:ParB family transcriptional regulator, chromosome partitioning protein